MCYYNFRTVINSWLKTSKMKLVYILKRDQNSAKIIHADNDKKGAFIIFWANFIPLQRCPDVVSSPAKIINTLKNVN